MFSSFGERPFACGLAKKQQTIFCIIVVDTRMTTAISLLIISIFQYETSFLGLFFKSRMFLSPRTHSNPCYYQNQQELAGRSNPFLFEDPVRMTEPDPERSM